MEDASIQRSVAVECIEWHPQQSIIAIGWRSGEISLHNCREHDSSEQSSVHRAPLVFTVWNATGSRLISGDKVRMHVVSLPIILYSAPFFPFVLVSMQLCCMISDHSLFSSFVAFPFSTCARKLLDLRK